MEGPLVFAVIMSVAFVSTFISVIVHNFYSKYSSWKYTKEKYKYRNITFHMFCACYLLAPSKWDLLDDYVLFDSTAMAFSTFSDYKKYIRFKQEKEDFEERASAEKMMDHVMEELYNLYSAKADQKWKKK